MCDCVTTVVEALWECMQFVATLTHAPANCWAHEEKQEMAKEWLASLDERAAAHDVTLDGAYAAPNEHRFVFVMEASSFESVTGFLGSPFLEDHEGDVVPVLPMSEAADVVLED